MIAMPHHSADPFYRLESICGDHHGSPSFLVGPTSRDPDGLAVRESERGGKDKSARTENPFVLTASIAHELNQPLSTIILNSQAGLRWLARADVDIEKVRDLARRVIADARRASAIVRSYPRRNKRATATLNSTGAPSAPERKTQRMPLRTRRSFTRGTLHGFFASMGRRHRKLNPPRRLTIAGVRVTAPNERVTAR
jgi:hypothetical protein